jgi:hypothetical protein
MKVTHWADVNGVSMFFRVMDDSEGTECGRFASEAEANAFLRGFLAGQSSWSSLGEGNEDAARIDEIERQKRSNRDAEEEEDLYSDREARAEFERASG